jgi:hypothetical protein
MATPRIRYFLVAAHGLDLPKGITDTSARKGLVLVSRFDNHSPAAPPPDPLESSALRVAETGKLILFLPLCGGPLAFTLPALA